MRIQLQFKEDLKKYLLTFDELVDPDSRRDLIGLEHTHESGMVHVEASALLDKKDIDLLAVLVGES